MEDENIFNIYNWMVEKDDEVYNQYLSTIAIYIVALSSAIAIVINWLEITYISLSYVFCIAALCICAIIVETIICAPSVLWGILRIIVWMTIGAIFSFVMVFLSCLFVTVGVFYLLYKLFTGGISTIISSWNTPSFTIRTNGGGFRTLRESGASFVDEFGERWKQISQDLFRRE